MLRKGGLFKMTTSGGKQKVLHVNESGLYQLIFQSRKPKARRFTRWVTSEVLPSIRKTGGYSGIKIPESIYVNNHLCHPYLHWCLQNGYSVRSGAFSKRIRKHAHHFIKHNNLWYISENYGQAILAYRQSLKRIQSASPISQILMYRQENQTLLT